MRRAGYSSVSFPATASSMADLPAPPIAQRHGPTALAVLALATGVLGIGAAWTWFNAYSGALNGWVALLAAADAALLLRLAGMARGSARAWLGVASVLACIVVAGWMSAALQVGAAMGLRPMESAWRMGPELAWTLSGAAATPLDLAAAAAALSLAWWWCR